MSRKKTAEENQALPAKSQFLLYQTEDGQTRIEVRLQDETVWMTQAAMADLYQTTPQNITTHLKAIYVEGELDEAATCKEYLQVQHLAKFIENDVISIPEILLGKKLDDLPERQRIFFERMMIPREVL